MQINARAGVTFATALRSILRSDPDVVMVGEIRDGETAKIAIEAALTGHFVLSTLHTNDAPSALTRLNEMGVEPFLTGAAVTGVLAQRLARKLCSHCCELYTPTADELVSGPRLAGRDRPERRDDALPQAGLPPLRPDAATGAASASTSSSSMTEDLASLAAAKASREEIERAAHATGMRTLWDDGIAKIKAGLTDLEELMRVTGVGRSRRVCV